MDASFATRLLDILIENSARILRAGFGVNHAEETFFEVIRLLQNERAVLPHLLDKIRDTLETRDPGLLEPGMVPQELIELIAHEFRWKELEVLAQKRIGRYFGGDASLAVGDVAHGISEALLDDWQDRELYSHYREA
jgi:hypothetical protein